MARDDKGDAVQILDSILFYSAVITVTQDAAAAAAKRSYCIGRQHPLGVAERRGSIPVCVLGSDGAAVVKETEAET